MTHRAVELEPIEHLDSLPYRRSLEALVAHTYECEPCAEAFAADESRCTDFCRATGHDLYHGVHRAVEKQHTDSRWN